jgi:hypothetical protein
MFPPGRARLAMSPPATGSPVVTITMGIAPVAFFTAITPGVDPTTITSALSRTSSAAKSTRRSILPSAYRSSSVTFCPSTCPSSRKPWRSASTSRGAPNALAGTNALIRWTFFGCCWVSDAAVRPGFGHFYGGGDLEGSLGVWFLFGVPPRRGQRDRILFGAFLMAVALLVGGGGALSIDGLLGR